VKKYTPTPRSRIKRLHEYGSYSKEDVYKIIDGHFMCHVSFQKAAQPFIIPTSHWREGNKLYWHGSSKSHMVQHLAKGNECAVAITHLDGLVLARSGFETSVNYRTAICYGTPGLITDMDEFTRQQKLFMEKLEPGRWDKLRPMKPQEVKATSMLVMKIIDASAKISNGGPDDEGDDISWPVWAGHVDIKTVVGDAHKADDSHDSPKGNVMPNFFKR